MHKNKCLGVILLAGLMCLSLFGCGDDGHSKPAASEIDLTGVQTAYYPFEGTTDDEEGENDGMPSPGVIYTEGVIGRALSLDGANWVDLPNGSTVFGDHPGGYSFSGWFKMSQVQESIILSDYRSGGWDGLYGIQLVIRSDQLLESTLRYTNEDNSHVGYGVRSIQAIDPEVWTFFTVVVDYDNKLFSMYLDSQLQMEEQIYTGVDYITDSPIFVGKSIFLGEDHMLFTGEIDELRFFNRPLLPSEIESLFQDQNETIN